MSNLKVFGGFFWGYSKNKPDKKEFSV